MQLFIDANIFLSFYDFTSDDLKELDKLALLIQNKKVTLQLPQQVIDEILAKPRNEAQWQFSEIQK